MSLVPPIYTLKNTQPYFLEQSPFIFWFRTICRLNCCVPINKSGRLARPNWELSINFYDSRGNAIFPTFYLFFVRNSSKINKWQFCLVLYGVVKKGRLGNRTIGVCKSSRLFNKISRIKWTLFFCLPLAMDLPLVIITIFKSVTFSVLLILLIMVYRSCNDWRLSLVLNPHGIQYSV